MGNKLGIDLGGTKIEAIVINDAFQVVKRKRVPTNREEGYEAILGRIVKLANELMEIPHTYITTFCTSKFIKNT